MMWKKRICEVFIVIGVLLIIGFVASIAYKYFSNTWRAGSLPFYTIVIIEGLELLIPGIIITVVAFILRAKS